MQQQPEKSACDAFYRKLVELSLPLITHTGEEQAVDAGTRQARTTTGIRAIGQVVDVYVRSRSGSSA